MNLFDKAYKVGRETFLEEGRVRTVSVPAEELIRETTVPILDVLNVYFVGIHDGDMLRADVDLLAGGNFTAAELAAFPSAKSRAKNEKEYSYE